MGNDPTGYPKRSDCFAHRFCRLLFKTCVANEIGPEGCWLLTVIAHTEDAKRYRGAVSFFNMQLAPLAGLGSVDALDRVRRKAVDAGWLHYTPGAKGVAGRYWVLIPEQFQGMDDAPTDENTRDYAPGNLRESAEATPREAEGKCGSNRGECADHSSLALSLKTHTPAEGVGVQNTAPESPPPQSPKPRPKRPTPDANPRFARFWCQYPRKAKKAEAARAFAAIDPDEHLLGVMLATLAWQNESIDWQKENGRFIPYPASWLNGRRWEDEPPRAAGRAPPAASNIPSMAEARRSEQASAGVIIPHPRSLANGAR